MKTICPHCKEEFPETPDEYLGMMLECPSCRKQFVCEKPQFCSECGAANPAKASACGRCGHSFSETPPPSPPPRPPATHPVPMTDCPACGNKVSSQAAACPHCGQPIRPVLKGAPIAAASMSGRETWTPWSSKNKTVSAAVSFSNIRITPDAILQRVRSAFSHHGFSVKQGKVRDGTAVTIGGFSGGDGGLVGGLTAIDKNTWNPFLASRAGISFIEAEITVLNVRQRMQTQDAVSSLMVQDIELQIKIRMPEEKVNFIAVACSVLGCVLGGGVRALLNTGGRGRGDGGRNRRRFRYRFCRLEFSSFELLDRVQCQTIIRSHRQSC